MDVDEFVYIRDPDPICLLYQRMPPRRLERLHLIIAVGRGVGQMGNDAMILQAVQHPVRRIGAIVGIKQKIRHADDTVKGNPLQKERALVLDTCDGSDAHIRHHPALHRRVGTVSCLPLGTGCNMPRASLLLVLLWQRGRITSINHHPMQGCVAIPQRSALDPDPRKCTFDQRGEQYDRHIQHRCRAKDAQ